MAVKGYKRRTKLEELKDTREIMRGAAPRAAAYIRDVVTTKVKRPSYIRVECAKYIVDHQIGKAPQRHELTGVDGKPLTLLELCLAAEAAGLLPPAPPPENGGDGGGEIIEGEAKVLGEEGQKGAEKV
jgi:hypothetical protein